MGQESNIVLTIMEAGLPPQKTFQFHVRVDGQVLASNRNLSQDQTREVSEISRRYGEMFEHPCAPRMTIQSQEALGKELFDLWLAPYWDKINQNVPDS